MKKSQSFEAEMAVFHVLVEHCEESDEEERDGVASPCLRSPGIKEESHLPPPVEALVHIEESARNETLRKRD